VGKYIAILILILVPAVASASGGVLRGIMMAQNTDTTAPTVSSATIGTNGTTLTLAMSETVTRSGGTFDVDCSTAGNNITATYSSGSGSSSLVYTLGTTVNSGDTCNLDYDGASNGIEDAAGNDLAAITNGTVTNNSTQGGADYTATVAKVYLRDDSGVHQSFRVAVYNSSGTRIAESDTGTTVSADGTRSVSFSSPPTLSSAGTYYISLYGTGSIDNYSDAGAWRQQYTTVTWPDSSSTITPGSDSGLNRGEYAIWLENASGQKIVGDNDLSDKTTPSNTSSGSNNVYLIDGYTRETL
jgi:hypothetical protein